MGHSHPYSHHNTDEVRKTTMDPRKARLAQMATYASVSVALILIGSKFYAWYISNSLSLLSTLVDSILDAAASLLTMYAVRHAIRPADEEHRFGHAKAEALAALAQSAFIMGSAVWLLAEAVERFITPEKVSETTTGIIVMIIAITMTIGLVMFQRYVIRETSSLAIKADLAHYKTDLFINIGVIIALLGTRWFEISYIDPFIGSVIAFYILWTAWSILIEAVHILMDRELPDEDRAKIKSIALSHPEVKGMHDLRTRSAGYQVFIQLHLELDGSMSLSEAHHISEAVMDHIMQAYPNAEVLIHEDPPTVDGVQL